MGKRYAGDVLMTIAVLLRSGVMGNYHAPFWRAVEGATSSLTLLSVCGNIQDMPLCERVYHCQNCGQVMDRDLNASINLENWTNNADGLSVNPERSRRVNACGLEGAVSLG